MKSFPDVFALPDMGGVLAAADEPTTAVRRAVGRALGQIEVAFQKSDRHSNPHHRIQ